MNPDGNDPLSLTDRSAVDYAARTKRTMMMLQLIRAEKRMRKKGKIGFPLECCQQIACVFFQDLYTHKKAPYNCT